MGKEVERYELQELLRDIHTLRDRVIALERRTPNEEKWHWTTEPPIFACKMVYHEPETHREGSSLSPQACYDACDIANITDPRSEIPELVRKAKAYDELRTQFERGLNAF